MKMKIFLLSLSVMFLSCFVAIAPVVAQGGNLIPQGNNQQLKSELFDCSLEKDVGHFHYNVKTGCFDAHVNATGNLDKTKEYYIYIPCTQWVPCGPFWCSWDVTLIRGPYSPNRGRILNVLKVPLDDNPDDDITFYPGSYYQSPYICEAVEIGVEAAER